MMSAQTALPPGELGAVTLQGKPQKVGNSRVRTPLMTRGLLWVSIDSSCCCCYHQHETWGPWDLSHLVHWLLCELDQCGWFKDEESYNAILD